MCDHCENDNATVEERQATAMREALAWIDAGKVKLAKSTLEGALES